MTELKLPEPDTHCLDDEGGRPIDVWSYSPELVREILAQQSARHAEELAEYELTVSNLRGQALADIAAEAQDAGEYTAPQAQPERKSTTDDECVTLFRRVQRGMGFKDQDLIPFVSGVAAGEHFHGIKEKP